MKKVIIIFSIFVVVVVVFFFIRNRNQVTFDTDYPASQNYEFHQIYELTSGKFGSGLYDTEGFVVKNYDCPPCPTGAFCSTSKICMRNNIVISNKNIPLETYDLSENELIIFVDHSERFELGKKYRFSIKMLESKSTSKLNNDVELVGFNSIKSVSK